MWRVWRVWPGAWSFQVLPEPDPPVCWVRNLRVNQKTNPQFWLYGAPTCVQPQPGRESPEAG